MTLPVRASFLPGNLAPLAGHIMALNRPDAYRRLVVSGPGHPEAEALLNPLQPGQLLQAAPGTAAPKNPDEAQALLAGLWLWHDWLDRAHTIAQSLTSPTGSFWHAIMHRREGDFANSKYWYARCANHPILSALAAQAGGLLDPHPPHRSLLRLLSGNWSPEAFVDLVAEVHDRPDEPRHAVAVELQHLEWRLLFDHCARQATG